MFNSKASLILSILTIILSLFYFYSNLDSLDRLNPSYYTIYDIPLGSNDLALSYEGECLGHLNLTHKVDTLISIFANIEEPKTKDNSNDEKILAEAKSYFNILGQLISLELSYRNKTYSIKGVKDLTLSYKNDKGKEQVEVFKGPLNILIEDQRLKVIYRYPIDQRHFLKDIEIIERKDCA